jgi:hypothetical protein
MVRLPDIPQQSWLDDQVNRFKETTSGYLDSLFFDDQARQQEAEIPPDFDAPGGRDQWEQAAIQRREEELRRQQEEEERRIQAQQAADAQQQANEAQRQQIDEERRKVEQAQNSAGFLSNLGIPTPEEAFSQLTGVFNRPRDNASSTGVLDASAGASPQPAEQPSQSPAGDFLSWARGLTEPLLGSSDTPPAATGDSGSSGSVPSSIEPESTLPPLNDHESSSGIWDRVAELPGKAAADLGRFADKFVAGVAPKKGFVEGLQQAYERIPGGADLSNLEFGDYSPEVAPPSDEASRLMLESLRGAGESVRAGVTSGFESLGMNPATAYQVAQDVSGVLGPAGAVIGGIQDIHQTGQAVQAIKALRAAKLGEDVILAAERRLAEMAGSTLSGIQELTRGKKVAAATRRAETAREQAITSHPEFATYDEAIQAAAQNEDVAFSALQQAEAQFGERSSQFRQAERAWVDAQSTHAEAIQAQEAVRQRLLKEIPDLPEPAVSAVSPQAAQKAFNSVEEIYATAVTAERDAARRFGPGSEEHQAAQDTLDFVSEQLERRRADLPGSQPQAPSAEVPSLYTLTDEERALNAAADARAKAQPPHAGYLEDATYGIDTETGLVAERPPAVTPTTSAAPPASIASSANVPSYLKAKWANDYEVAHRAGYVDDILSGLAQEKTADELYQSGVLSGMNRTDAIEIIRGVRNHLDIPRSSPTGGLMQGAAVDPADLAKFQQWRDAYQSGAWKAPVPGQPPASAAAASRLTPPSGTTPAAAETGAAPLATEAERLAQRAAAMRASEAEGIPPPARQLTEQARTPTPKEAALPRVVPERPSPGGPARPGQGPGSTPEGKQRAIDDRAVIATMLEQGRSEARHATPDDVRRVLNGIRSAKQSVTDRRARLGATEKYIERLRGRPLDINERAWLLARVYEGREDAALLRMERMLQNPLTQVGPKHLPLLDQVAVQLDNVGVDWLARMKEQGRVERTIPQVRARQQAPVNEIRRTGEAALNEGRARASMRSAEREWIGAMNERNALLKEMDTLGEGPTRGVESNYARRKRAVRGHGPDRVMETDRSMSAQERLERVNIRLETAKARHADARQIVDDIVAAKRDAAEGKTRVRAAERAEQVGANRKYSGGATVQEVDDILDSLADQVGPEKAKHIADGLDALYRYRDAVRDRLVESGIWSKETGETFKQSHPYYVPTKILEKLDEKFLNDLPTGGRTFSSASDLIKHITPEGTDAARLNPIRSIMEMGFQGEAAARRNEVMKAVAGWADQEGMENFVKKLKTSESAPQGYKKMSAMIDGKSQSIAVHNLLAQSLEMGNPGWTGILGAAAKGASMPLRAGATALRPAFIATNAVNDAMLTLFRFAAEDPWYKAPNPIARTRDLMDLFNGYHLAFGAANPATQAATGAFIGGGVETAREGAEGKYPWNTPDYWQNIATAAGIGAGAGLARRLRPVDRAMLERFRESGASMGMQSRFSNPDDIARQLAGEHVWVRKLTNEEDWAGWLSNHAARASDVAGLLWSRPLAAVGNVIESAPRYAAFSRAERQTQQAIGKELAAARRQGASISAEREAEIRDALMQQQMPEIANKARRVTADFAAGGSFIKTLNQISPFLNASMQAAVEGGDMLQKSPSGVAAATSAIVAATVLSEIHNRSVAPDDYKNVSEFTKNTGIVILSDKEPEGEGKRGLVYIPTRGMVGALVPLTKAAMSIAVGDDHRSWLKLAADVGLATVNQMSPVNADIGDIVNMFIPPPFSLANQYRANYDAFRDQPIISRSMESLPPSEQYDDRTSQFSRHVARNPLFKQLPIFQSPVATDWLIKGFSPGPGEAFLSTADEIIKRSGNTLPEVTRDVPKGIRDVAPYGTIMGRFLRTVGSAEQNRAYELADEIAARESVDLVRELEADPSYQNATPDRQRQRMRSLQGYIQEKAKALAGVEEKERDIGLPERFYGVPPGSALEREIATALDTPAKDRTDEQRTLYYQYKYQKNPEYTERRREQTDESKALRQRVMGR